MPGLRHTMLAALAGLSLAPLGQALAEPGPPAAPGDARVDTRVARASACAPEMVRVRGFCVDRWEASMVDATTGRDLSPYYPPHPKLLARVREVWEVERKNLGEVGAAAMPLPDLPAWQLTERFEAKAVSRPGAVPQGYLTYYLAKRACAAANKRLCTEDEWVAACRGARDTKFPYGAHYVATRCNVFRAIHPASVLHGNASIGLTDPRLNLVVEKGSDPLLRVTGATPGCASTWSGQDIYDMVGNVDEWVEDPKGVFVGGFYSRMTTKGCEAKVRGHAPAYYDYSTGTRCCSDAR